MEKIKTKRLIKRIGAAVLCIGMAACAVVGIGYSAGYFSRDNVSSESLVSDADTLLFNNTGNNGISLTGMAVQVDGESYESYYEVTAMVDSENASDKSITWTLAWSDETEDVLSDYLRLSSSTSESGNSIRVYCYGAFSTQATLTAVANGGEDTTAEATIDYICRYEGFNLYYSYQWRDVTPDSVDYYYRHITCTSSGAVSSWYSDSQYGVLSNSLFEDFYSDDGLYLDLDYGTGSKNDNYVVDNFSISLTDEAATYFAGFTDKYSISSFGYYDIYDLFTSDEIFGSIFGVDDTVIEDESFRSDLYDVLITIYEDNVSLFEIELDIHGSISGLEYTFTSQATLEPSAYYVSVASVYLNETDLNF